MEGPRLFSQKISKILRPTPPIENLPSLTNLTSVWYTFERASKENSALSEHKCLTNQTIGWDKSKIVTTNRRYYQRLCLEAWHINSAHAPLNCDDGGLLLDAYLHRIKGPLVAAFRSPLSEGTRQEFRNVGSMNCNFSVIFIKFLNQSSIKPCQTTILTHLVFSITTCNICKEAVFLLHFFSIQFCSNQE